MSSEDKLEQIYRTVVSIRQSIDPIRRIHGSRTNEQIESFKSVALRLESIRLDLMFIRRRRDFFSQEALHKVRNELDKLLDDPDFQYLAENKKLRILPRSAPDGTFLLELERRDITITDATRIIVQEIDNFIDYDNNIDSESVRLDLRGIIPEQKLAPVMFEIIAGKIAVMPQFAKTRPEDAENAIRAREALLERGESIITALENSNCDHRILASMRELQTELGRRDNIIELGLINMAVERVCKGAAAELPDALLGAIEGQTAGIGMYVAQFTEWQRFSENAASVELAPSDIEMIGAASQTVIDSLIKSPEIAYEEVPKTLKYLKSLIANPTLATKRAAFAVLRSIENLIAKIYEYGLSFLDKTVSKTVEGLSQAASKVIIGSLLTVALAATVNLGDVTIKISEAAWMKKAAEIVRAQLDQLIASEK